jgi:hypothetical protein
MLVQEKPRCRELVPLSAFLPPESFSLFSRRTRKFDIRSTCLYLSAQARPGMRREYDISATEIHILIRNTCPETDKILLIGTLRSCI